MEVGLYGVGEGKRGGYGAVSYRDCFFFLGESCVLDVIYMILRLLGSFFNDN